MRTVRDRTAYVVEDSSNGPGPYVKRVAQTKGAKVVSEGMQRVLDSIEHNPDQTIGFVSKALAYGVPTTSKIHHANLVRLVKGGHVSICEVDGKPPSGSRAAKTAPYGDRYYVMRRGACPLELPDGALAGARRRKR